MVARVASEVISLASAVVLARLIAPSEFGEAVVPLIFVPLAVIFTFEGLGSALVQRKEIDHTHVEAAMLASLITGAVLSAATFLLADPVGGQLFGKASAELLQIDLAGLPACRPGSGLARPALAPSRLPPRQPDRNGLARPRRGLRGRDGGRGARRRGDRARRPDRDLRRPPCCC